MSPKLLSILKPLAFCATMLSVCALVYQRRPPAEELSNRIPEAAPYVTSEAQFFAPPYEEYWKTVDNPGQCQSCHRRTFEEWNGSMMANAWRDPVWRGAFLLAARATSTNGDCDAPEPPDGTPKARHNPFAKEGECISSFDIGGARRTLSRPGSLLDGFCSRCHMPSNYVDNVPLHNVAADTPSGLEHGDLDHRFDPTSDNGTGLAFATLESQFRNTDSGKNGVSCAICHTMAESRNTPYHNLPRAQQPPRPEYVPALGNQARSALLPERQYDSFHPPDESQPNLGYAIGAGSFRLSPHAIAFSERFGPLAAAGTGGEEHYLEGVFKRPMAYEQVDSSKHQGYRHVMLTRAELCSACHDVTNPLTINNSLGHWVGGFPIERTYAEWLSSRYAERPGNRNFDPAFKRDCQTCHMQQDYGQPGTAQTLYTNGVPREPLRDRLADDTTERAYFSHHFVGGNSYVPQMIGANLGPTGAVEGYPELSVFSFSSADPKSPYANAYWTGDPKRGAVVQQARLAWDRLRNVLDLDVSGAGAAAPGRRVPISIRVTNSGSGHKFPTGFPEGRIAWLAVSAFDLGTGRELEIYDSAWKRSARGVGRLTQTEMLDPNFPRCGWSLPPGSPDPFAVQFKAVASLGDGCPTLDLMYAHALNLVVNRDGQPVDANGRVIDRKFPAGLPQFKDLDGDGDVYDDSFLRDTRLDPLPLPGASLKLDRYAVVIPADAAGPVAVTAAVYYQSVEAMVALKFLGNLADTDRDRQLEPCVLGGSCDGRTSSVEPAVVEGSAPVPMEVRSMVIHLGHAATRPSPQPTLYPRPDATGVYRDVVVKASFAEPVRGLDQATFTLQDASGARVPASVDQIGDSTWGLFPHGVFLKGGETYTAQIAANVCGASDNCSRQPFSWHFTTSATKGEGRGDTRVSLGFGAPAAGTPATLPIAVKAVDASAAGIVVTFSAPVVNVTAHTFRVGQAVAAAGCENARPVPGKLGSNPAGDVWTYEPQAALDAGATYCVLVTTGVYDMAGRNLAQPFSRPVSQRTQATHRTSIQGEPHARSSDQQP